MERGPPSQGLLLPFITYALNQNVPCDPTASHQPPYLVRHESKRCGGIIIIIHLVGVNLTEWRGCLLAICCCYPLTHFFFTRLFPVTPQHHTSHPTWSDMNHCGMKAAAPSYLWWGSILLSGEGAS